MPIQRAELEKQVQDLIRRHNVPGLGFGWVRAGQVAWVEGFGYADLKAQRRATADTAFHLASVSKVVTGTALMQLWQLGRFNLDDPIPPLDFPVQNPRHRGVQMTFRHLCTHTSSIADANYEKQDFTRPGDPIIELRAFLAFYLTPESWINREGSFEDWEPGKYYSYSNVGTALAGHLAAIINRQPLQQQTSDRIFDPLKMSPATWTDAGLGAALRATPYVEEQGKLFPIDPIGYPDWPAGLLRASAHAMIQFIAAFANGGELGGKRILLQATVDEMMKTSPPRLPPNGRKNKHVVGQGLFWEGLPGLVGKLGADKGAQALVAIDRPSRNGVVILTNRSSADPRRTDALEDAMVALAQAAVS
jgi:CubicO group peptidase (beta-lactamase class C family)